MFNESSKFLGFGGVLCLLTRLLWVVHIYTAAVVVADFQGDEQGKMRVKVHLVNRNSQAVYGGVVSHKTHVICRSRSSRIFWLVQVRVCRTLFDGRASGPRRTPDP